MSGMSHGQEELSLEILLGDFKILHGHVWALVTEQFHDAGKADACPEHLRSIGVTKLVRDDAGGNSDSGYDILQCRADSTNQHFATARPKQ